MRQAAVFILVAAAVLGASHAYVSSPIVGYQQGVAVQVLPGASTGAQCDINNIPYPGGYTTRAGGPLFLYFPKGTGAHILSYLYDTSAYTLVTSTSPGTSRLQYNGDPTNPQQIFDSSVTNVNDYGVVVALLVDKNTQATVCQVQIQLQVTDQLTCLPGFGGVNGGFPGSGGGGGGGSGGGGGGGGGGGTVVFPSGPVYISNTVSQTIINNFVQINQINIVNINTNINVIVNQTIINQITVLPPSPAPVNCTQDPANPACQRLPPRPGPTSQPTTQPPQVGPPTGSTTTGGATSNAVQPPTTSRTTQTTGGPTQVNPGSTLTSSSTTASSSLPPVRGPSGATSSGK